MTENSTPGSIGIEGKVALVTGSLDGVGYATARALALQGCRVMMHGLAEPAIAEEKRAALQQETGARIAFNGADLSDQVQTHQLFEETVRALGPVQILVNNAVTRNFSSLETLPLEQWSYALAVNLTAPFQLTQLTVPGMRAQKWGRIINIASNFGVTGTVNRIDYVASKHGVVGLTRATALEVVADGITCNAICPGATHTPHTERQMTELMERDRMTHEEAMRKLLSQRQPSRRFIKPTQIAQLIVFLCSEAASEMTATPIAIDGGWQAM